MTRDDCKRVLQSLEVIRHCAEGGSLEYSLIDYKGRFIRWCHAETPNLSCLGRYRIPPLPAPEFDPTNDCRFSG